MNFPLIVFQWITSKAVQLRAFSYNRWERLQYVWTPKNVMDDDTRERRFKRGWMVLKQLLWSYVGAIGLFLLLSPLLGRWSLQWFAINSNAQATHSSTALEAAPELHIWLTDVRELETGLLAPPFQSFELYKRTTHICSLIPEFVWLVVVDGNSHDDAKTNNRTTTALPTPAVDVDTSAHRIDQLRNLFFHNVRDRRFVSVYAIAKAMIGAYKGNSETTNVLCTYMFGNWSALASPLPCFCITLTKLGASNTHANDAIADDSVAGAIFAPQIKRQSENLVRARVHNVMGFISPYETNAMPDANVRTFVRMLPKFIETSFDHLSARQYHQQQRTRHTSTHDQQLILKSIDQRANRLRHYTPVDMAHTSMTVVTVSEVNMWMTMCETLHLNFAVHDIPAVTPPSPTLGVI